MAHYRKIDTRIWNDEKFTSLSERGKLAFFFLLTHPNTTMLGGMRGTLPGIAAELFSHNTTSEALLEGFQKVFQEGYVDAFREATVKGMVKVDEKACLIWLPNFLKYNAPESPNVVKAWPRAYDLLPECQLKHELLSAASQYVLQLSKGFQQAFTEGFPKAMLKTMPNQEQEQEQEHTTELPFGNSVVPPPQTVIARLMLKTGKPWQVRIELATQLKDRYPHVDIEQQFRNMEGWLESNPAKRKTSDGMMRFVNRWLKGEEEKEADKKKPTDAKEWAAKNSRTYREFCQKLARVTKANTGREMTNGQWKNAISRVALEVGVPEHIAFQLEGV